MTMKLEQERVQNLLRDTVTTLCRNSLAYNRGIKVQGLLGITLDDEDVFVVHFNELFQGVGAQEVTIQQADSVSTSGAQTVDEFTEIPTTTSSRRKTRPSRAIGGLSEPVKRPRLYDDNGNYTDSVTIKDEPHDAYTSGTVDVDIMKQSYANNNNNNESESADESIDEATTDERLAPSNQGGPFIAGIALSFPTDSTEYPYESNNAAQDGLSMMSGKVIGRLSLPDGSGWDQYTTDSGEGSSPSAHQQPRRRNSQTPDPQDSTTDSDPKQAPPSARKSTNHGMALPVTSRRSSRRHTTQPKELYKCKDCDKTYWSRNTLVRHQKVHNPELYACKKCTLFFSSEEQLVSHDQAKHSGPAWGRYMCQICHKKFRSNSHLIGHMGTFHSKNMSRS